jgi:hypothetical protein
VRASGAKLQPEECDTSRNGYLSGSSIGLGELKSLTDRGVRSVSPQDWAAIRYDPFEVLLSITVQHGEADIVQVAWDVLGLTRLNYNACLPGESQSITVSLLFAENKAPKKVGVNGGVEPRYFGGEARF